MCHPAGISYIVIHVITDVFSVSVINMFIIKDVIIIYYFPYYQ